ncbi:MAG: methyltransferase [Paraglaciecola sp.]|uniref:methyltransferase n=1 Tax=Pseudomonadati TaxID=3379134 RepID=UPI00273DA68F|nr:methyltransferase [Paraglaciecola sp.]MDP5032623.1 methyltransferase [Paraglaciecola sp.]MDP5134040.1 methyltransferase [Paraglaciecola sp.]
MLAPTSQVLLRNSEIFTSGRWLLVNPADAHICQDLSDSDVSVFHQFFDIYQQSQRLGEAAKHRFGASYTSDELFDGAVIYMPKAKEHAKMLLANVAACLKPGAQLMLVGENKSGVKSAAKLLEPYCKQVNKIDSARHCALFGGELTQTAKPFDIIAWQTVQTIDVAGLSYQICSLPGVFSHGEVDIGTRVLLENLPRYHSGRVLDFGCGAGIIGCFVALSQPTSKVVMADVSALAVYCSEQSALLNKLNVDVQPSNGLKALSAKFTTIITNPPFHTGIQTDYSVTETFISDCKNYLTSEGALILVANQFLRYAELLEKQFKNVTLVQQTTKFSVYSCLRAR